MTLSSPSCPRPRSWLLLWLATALVATLALTALPGTAQAAGLVRNGSFDEGTRYWRTNGSAEVLRTESFSGNPAAVLTSTTQRHTVLNDATNSVADTGSTGATYRLSARVRGTSGTDGALRLREVGATGTREHQKAFELTGSWQTVSLPITTTRSGASLDVNVVAWNLAPGERLVVDDVTLTRTTTALPAPEPCTGRVPDTTLFGASMTTSGISAEDSLERLDQAFGTLPVVRIFDPGLPFEWSHARNDLLEGRTMVMSFRPMPQDVLAGRHDAFFRRWFAQAPEDRTIYWSYIHEPEPLIKSGRFTATQYKAAWRRIEALADEACKPNMFSTLILTGWTAIPASGRDYRDYDAGRDVIDVLAWDPYNGASDPDRDYYSPVSEFMAPAVQTSIADGRPWGIAETGSRLVPGDDGQGRAAWLRSVAEYAVRHDAQFVTYFQSTRDGDWRLNDRYSRAVWREFVAR
ncbi:carbohydrate binding domain-containing protein [Serinicoccus profundi]|uniref:carbohydrate binding domain-containing protein n=1 Tax=Serinicoccus profundi TaxID=1078471 RepID=UPI000255EA5E|nr:carbohydrate binding domain-containing protein [Serinicoccus profundi]